MLFFESISVICYSSMIFGRIRFIETGMSAWKGKMITLHKHGVECFKVASFLGIKSINFPNLWTPAKKLDFKCKGGGMGMGMAIS